jgi:hypothetical protein
MNNLFRVPVTERTLIRRLNRKPREHDLKVRKCRSSSRACREGAYLVVNSSHNPVVLLDSIDLQSLGRGAKVLADWETLKTSPSINATIEEVVALIPNR